MNLIHLKYATEIARLGSAAAAAESLCVGQPNLSRAIRELEASLGITIFERSARGMTPTPQGEEFLRYAQNALREIDEIEKLYRSGTLRKQRFSISVPRASYIANAFARFSNNIRRGEPAEIFYKETNAQRAIKNILEEDYRLGIIRYSGRHDYYFKQMLEQKGLTCELVCEFSYELIMSKASPLASLGEIRHSDLRGYIEIAHADPFVPSLPMATVRKEELDELVERRIFVFERSSQFELLEQNPSTFMWVSPVPQKMLDRYGLVHRSCLGEDRRYRDMLIFKEGYALTELDRAFITELTESKRRYIDRDKRGR